MIVVNKVILSGKLLAKPEGAPSNSGKVWTKILVVSPVGYGEKRHVATFEVKAFGKTAETIIQYGDKDKEVVIDGSLDPETWEKDGKQYSKLSIIANNITFGTSEKTPSSVPQVNKSPATQPARRPQTTNRPNTRPQQVQQSEFDNDSNNTVSENIDDDVPF